MNAITSAVCAMIPDALEQWLAAGGNSLILLAALAGAAVWPLAAPARPHHTTPVDVLAPATRPAPRVEDMTLPEARAYLRRLDQDARATRQDTAR